MSCGIVLYVVLHGEEEVLLYKLTTVALNMHCILLKCAVVYMCWLCLRQEWILIVAASPAPHCASSVCTHIG